MVGRNIVGGIGPLRVAGRGEREDCKGPDPTAFEEVLHLGASVSILRQSSKSLNWGSGDELE